MLGFWFLPGTRQENLFTIAANLLEQLAHAWERLDAWEVFFLKKVGSVLIEFFAELVHLLGGEKLGQVIIGSFADLFSEFLVGECLAEMAESAVPGINVELVGIDQRSVQIKDNRPERRKNVVLHLAPV